MLGGLVMDCRRKVRGGLGMLPSGLEEGSEVGEMMGNEALGC